MGFRAADDFAADAAHDHTGQHAVLSALNSALPSCLYKSDGHESHVRQTRLLYQVFYYFSNVIITVIRNGLLNSLSAI